MLESLRSVVQEVSGASGLDQGLGAPLRVHAARVGHHPDALLVAGGEDIPVTGLGEQDERLAVGR